MEAGAIDEQINTMSITMPLSLYIRLYNKYYYSKAWYLSKNKFSMLIFLMRMLRRKSDLPLSKIKLEIAVVAKQEKEWNDLKTKLNKIQSVINELSRDRDKIVAFLNQVENCED